MGLEGLAQLHSSPVVLMMLQCHPVSTRAVAGHGHVCCCLCLQASERLVQLSYAVLERFGLGVDAGSSSAQQQQPHSNGTSFNTRATSLSPAAVSRSSLVMGKGGSAGSLVSIAAASAEYTAFAPLVVATLKALSTLDAATFQAELARFFPVLTKLMTCDYATADVQRALSELFLVRVGPLLPTLTQSQG
eukprot:GHRQ01038778.1.p1 GENE.GHRQ01038778.1~~GHRQ01038778.1.p1  ORF type:complete len:190 (+),score=78.23 GHRQ01038778.1:58-627(+)